jgi:hypothetical protein
MARQAGYTVNFLILMSGAFAQCLQALLRLGLDVVQPVVAFRKDMGQPDRGRLPQAEALSVAMGWEVLVQQRRYAHPLHLGQQQRDVIHAFIGYDLSLGNTESLTQFSNLVQI